MNIQPTSSLPTTPQTRKPIYGLSQRVVALARSVDNLPPGRYVIEVVKEEIHAAAWKIEIAELHVVKKMNLSNYSPE